MALNIKQFTNSSKEVQEAPVNNGYIELELGDVIKFGYICEERGIYSPIYLKMNGAYTSFKIGKTGMFEISSDVGISGIKVPEGINFTIDCICNN